MGARNEAPAPVRRACLYPSNGASWSTSLVSAAARRARLFEACGDRSALSTSQRTITFPSPRMGSKQEKTGLGARSSGENIFFD